MPSKEERQPLVGSSSLVSSAVPPRGRTSQFYPAPRGRHPVTFIEDAYMTESLRKCEFDNGIEYTWYGKIRAYGYPYRTVPVLLPPPLESRGQNHPYSACSCSCPSEMVQVLYAGCTVLRRSSLAATSVVGRRWDRAVAERVDKSAQPRDKGPSTVSSSLYQPAGARLYISAIFPFFCPSHPPDPSSARSL